MTVFTQADIEEYKQSLIDDVKRIELNSWANCEHARDQLLDEFREINELLEREELTQEQWEDVYQTIDKLINEVEEQSKIKRVEWSHSSQF